MKVWKVRFLDLARQDLDKIYERYGGRYSALSKRFRQKLKIETDYLKQNPYVRPLHYKNVRTSLLEVFPYHLHYVIDEENHTMIVRAVFYAGRDPNIWETR